MRSGVFLLDLVSNALGAMLLLYFLAVPRRFETLPLELEESLWLEVTLSPPATQVDLFLTWPDGSKRHCQAADHLQYKPATERVEKAKVATRVGGSPASEASSRCAILIRDPPVGSWTWRAEVFGDSPPSESLWTLDAYVSGRSVSGAPVSLPFAYLTEVEGSLTIPPPDGDDRPQLEVNP